MADITRRIVIAGAAATAATTAFAQSPSNPSIVGTWTLASVYRELEDGSRVTNVMGENPKGLMMFDSHGRFSHHLIRAEGAKLDCKGIENPSPENMAAALGASSYFGTYEVAASGDSVVFNIEASLIARQIGAKQKRFIKVTADTMEYWTPRIESAKGAFVRRLVWRRVRGSA